jgi:hypothetical protein
MEKYTDVQRAAARKSWPDPARVACLNGGGWSDGNLKPFFDELGQNFRIDGGEIRTLPLWLMERCIASGARFELVPE